MTPFQQILIVLAAPALILCGCSSDAQKCGIDQDCFANEVCAAGRCAPPNGIADANTDGDVSRDTKSNEDTEVERDLSGDTSKQVDLEMDDTSSGQCVVDPFDSCDDPFEPPRNDSWIDSTRFPMSSGCVNNRDTLVTYNGSMDGRVCPNEEGDWYVKTVVPCDTITIALRGTLTVEPGCVDDVEFEFKRGGLAIPCDSQDFPITCRTEGNSKIIELVVPPEDSVFSMYFGVVQPMSKDRSVGYTLDVSVQ